MKIAFISFEYPPETGFGGIGTYTWYQARALAKLGHEVHVLCGAKQAMTLRTSEQDNVTVHRFRSHSGILKTFRLFGKFRMWWSKNRLENAISMYEAFRKLDRIHHYDLIEMPECGAEGLLINHFIDTPVIIKFHSPSQLIMPFYNVRRADILVCSFFEKIAMRRATAFSSCSQFLSDQAHEKLKITKPIRVIPNGIDLELFDSTPVSDVRERFGIPKNQLMILFAGRMENRKGISICKEIVPAILKKYDVSFVFAGQDLFSYMNDTLIPYWKSKKLRGTFHYLGKLEQEALRSCVREADIFLLPSLWENCPYACLEAMASSCSVISSDQGGMPEIISHEQNGMLAHSGDVQSYVEGLKRLIEDSELRERLGSAARETILRSFTDLKIARTSAEYYSEILYGKGRLDLQTNNSTEPFVQRL